MKIKITEKGFLEIERAGKWKKQYCPHDPETNEFGAGKCGDWCPLFGEIEIVTGAGTEYLSLALVICKKTFQGNRNEIIDDSSPLLLRILRKAKENPS